MKKVILDTNFILTCIRNKVDFFEEIPLMGIKIIIPQQVIEEVEKIMNSKKKLHFKEDAKIALKILEKNSFEKINLQGSYVDLGLENFAKKNKDILIATLDKDLKKKISNSKLIIRNRKKLEII